MREDTKTHTFRSTRSHSNLKTPAHTHTYAGVLHRVKYL